MGFHHVGQAGLELLTSGDPSASASQSAEITGVSHCTRPVVPFSMSLLKKNTKISWVRWHTPVILVTQEDEAQESLEPSRRRVQ